MFSLLAHRTTTRTRPTNLNRLVMRAASTRSMAVAPVVVPGHPLITAAPITQRSFSSTFDKNQQQQQQQQPPKDILAEMSTDTEESRQVYDKWAAEYDQDVAQWGYDLPERVATIVVQKLKSLKDDPDVVTPHTTSILDAGAGGGLVGAALRQHLLSDNREEVYIVGADYSLEMLRVAKARGCYDVTVQLDLNSIPFCDNTISNAILDACNEESSVNLFDCITCVGTLTYVDPSAGTLREFCRWAKPGGFICYTNRTDKLEAFRPFEEELEQEGLWKLVEKVGPIPYLPDHPDYADKIEVVIFMYQKTGE